MKVFVLHHVNKLLSGEEDVKLIGIYSSEASAQRAIERLSSQPGFRKYLEGFDIGCYELDKDHWTEGFLSTWVNKSGKIEYDG